jgi:C-terminal processing protease CtpA/Prc
MVYYLKIILTFLYLSLILQICPAQNALQIIRYNPNTLIDTAKLKEDFKVFKQTLLELHPNLYRYHSPAQFDSLFHLTEKELTTPRKEMEFFRYLANVIAFIQDGHTQIEPSKFFQIYLNQKAKFFPFHLKFLSGKAYVLLNGSNDESVKVGSEIISINGKKAQQVAEEIMQYFSIDAQIPTRKPWLLSQNFILRQYYFGQNSQNFILHLIDPLSNQAFKTMVEALPIDSVYKNIRNNITNQKSLRFFRNEVSKEKKPLKLTIRPKTQTAVLSVSSFKVKKFAKLLKNAFYLIKVKKVKNLVIDVRGNEGGFLQNAKLLYSYLSKESFATNDSIRLFRGEITYRQYTNFKYYSDNQMIKLKKTIPKLEKESQAIIHSTKIKMDSTYKPPKHYFEGRVYFLINGGTFSAANYFVSLAHNFKRGEFWGEESGGNYFENTGHLDKNPNILILPHTKIKFVFPAVLSKYNFGNYPYLNRGLIPDVKIQPKIKDIINGLDTELEELLEKIEQTNVVNNN